MAFSWDDFSRRLPNRSVSLLVEDRILWVSREMLAHYSPVFFRMFYGDFIESISDQIELPDKNADDILDMLRCTFPTGSRLKSIDYANVIAMSKLADEYEIPFLESRCLEFLNALPDGGDVNVKKIFLDGAKHGQKNVVRACLPLVARFDFANDVEPTLDELASGIRCAVLQQIIWQNKITSMVDSNQFSDDGFRSVRCDLRCGCGGFSILNEFNGFRQFESCKCLSPAAVNELEKIGM